MKELGDVKNFVKTAREFCIFIESTDNTGKNFLRKLQALLLVLYYHATTLSWTSWDRDDVFAEKLTKEETDKVLMKISDKIGDDRFYWLVFDPTDHTDTEPVCGDLVDDLGDTYSDVKNGLLNFELGTVASKEKAVWDWKFGFEKHWGQHVIDALRTIHFLLEQ